MTSDQGNASNAEATEKVGTVAAACCGGGRASTGSAVTVVAPCCGTAEAATAFDACCDPDAKTAAVQAGAGCCG